LSGSPFKPPALPRVSDRFYGFPGKIYDFESITDIMSGTSTQNKKAGSKTKIFEA
jgi:hypothetical protein